MNLKLWIGASLPVSLLDQSIPSRLFLCYATIASKEQTSKSYRRTRQARTGISSKISRQGTDNKLWRRCRHNLMKNTVEGLGIT